jgi:hypothetical protein
MAPPLVSSLLVFSEVTVRSSSYSNSNRSD